MYITGGLFLGQSEHPVLGGAWGYGGPPLLYMSQAVPAQLLAKNQASPPRAPIGAQNSGPGGTHIPSTPPKAAPPAMSCKHSFIVQSNPKGSRNMNVLLAAIT